MPRDDASDPIQSLNAHVPCQDLAYLRTALSELSFGVLVIKLFDSRFQVIGAIYALICATIAGIALWRSRVSRLEAPSGTHLTADVFCLYLGLAAGAEKPVQDHGAQDCTHR